MGRGDRHKGDVEFTKTHPQQVHARDVETGEIVFLPDGCADELRADCRAGRLICPIPGCPDPAFNTRGGKVKRHHFYHLSGGRHSPESLNHWTAKHVLRDWLWSTHLEVDVELESRVLPLERIPDVLATRMTADGPRHLVVEVQYSPLTADEMRERTRDYRGIGVVVVWVLGHTKTHWRPPRHSPFSSIGSMCQCFCEECCDAMTELGEDPYKTPESPEEAVPLEEAATSDLQDAIQQEVGAVYWIDPWKKLLATRLEHDENLVGIVPLETARLRNGAIESGTTNLEREIDSRRRNNHERRLSKLQARRRAQKERQIRERKEGRRRFRLLREGPSPLPWPMFRRTRNQEDWPHDATLWKCVLWEDLISQRLGSSFEYRAAFRVLRKKGLTELGLSWALDPFLYCLRKAGVLEFQASPPEGLWHDNPIVSVVSLTDTPPASGGLR